ncbi:MAG TPA: DUF2905 domain-containing protein [Candidatus Binataceae bacterium]|jgi:ribose/xylose/arabinose/galactoside ABC-type transport system permease subunit|nr:DUF2905 domain-containing protein [Candidatus Binataceae bacterium]
MVNLAKMLITLGVAIVALGVLLWLGGSVAGFDRIGRLPGDIYLKRGNFTFYFPLTTSIAVSIILTVILLLLRR